MRRTLPSLRGRVALDDVVRVRRSAPVPMLSDVMFRRTDSNVVSVHKDAAIEIPLRLCVCVRERERERDEERLY